MAEQIQQLIRMLKLDALDSNESIVFIKEKTSLRPSQLAFAIIVFLTIVLIIAQASTLVTCIGCFLIPAYFSFLSLQSHDHRKDVKYLTYWVIFSVTEVVSFLFQWMLGATVYSLIRVALTVAFLHPQLELSQKIYHGFIAPYVMKYEKTIDQKAQDLLEKGKQRVDQFTQKGKRILEEQVKKVQ